MDLSNKTVTITYMSTTSYPEETVVKVVISQELAAGVFKTLDTYDLKYEKMYSNTQDPALLAAINETLTAL